MKTLYVNGGSWAWTKNLMDPESWVNIVAHNLGMQIINQSVGCGSNSRVVDNLCNFFADGTLPDLIVLALTFHHRWHLPGKNFSSWSIGPVVAINDSTGETSNDIRNCFYSHCHDDLDSIYRYYRTIWQIYAFCAKYQIKPWIFQTSDQALYELHLLADNNVENFVDSFDIDDYYRDLYKKRFRFFREESVNWNYIEKPFSSELSPKDLDSTGHPNKKGHEIIANIVMTTLQQSQEC